MIPRNESAPHKALLHRTTETGNSLHTYLVSYDVAGIPTCVVRPHTLAFPLDPVHLTDMRTSLFCG